MRSVTLVKARQSPTRPDHDSESGFPIIGTLWDPHTPFFGLGQIPPDSFVLSPSSTPCSPPNTGASPLRDQTQARSQSRDAVAESFRGGRASYTLRHHSSLGLLDNFHTQSKPRKITPAVLPHSSSTPSIRGPAINGSEHQDNTVWIKLRSWPSRAKLRYRVSGTKKTLKKLLPAIPAHGCLL